MMKKNIFNKSLLARSVSFLLITAVFILNLQYVLVGSSLPAYASQGFTITSTVNSSSDDAEEFLPSGGMYLTSSDLEFVMDGSVQQIVGMRFTGINVPQGSTITAAAITFTVDEVQTTATSLSIFGQAIDNSPTFSAASYELEQRQKTNNRADWSNLPAWTVAGMQVTTPDIAPVIQEIISRPGWAANNALAIIVTGSGHRTAEAFDGAPSQAALLTISYTTDVFVPSITPTVNPVVPSATATPLPSPTVTPLPTSTPPNPSPSPNPLFSPTPSPTFPPSSARFAVIGDFGSGDSHEAAVANLIKSFSPDFIATVGDNNYPLGEALTIDVNIGQFYSNYIYPYSGAYGSSAASNNFYPVPGNHDWIPPNLQPYRDYFTLPNNERYYDFVRGPIHFFMLDMDYSEPDGYTSTSIQAQWLKNGLAQSTAPFQLVFMHRAPYSSGLNHGSSLSSQWPFALWGADAVLAGHDHLYERLTVDNIPYFVNGSGGDGLYSFGTILPESQARYNQDYGAMLVSADNASITFNFYNVAGMLIDSVRITNLQGPSPSSTPEPTATCTPAPTATDTPLPTATNTALPSDTNTPLPSATFTPLPTATNTPLPTATNTSLPSATFTPLPTVTFTPSPTVTFAPLPTFSLSILPLADTYADIKNPRTNYGMTTLNKVDGLPVKITYLKFDLSGLAGRSIISAALLMRVSDKTASVQNIKNVSDITWLETGLTYNNRPALSTTLASFTAPSTNVTLSVNITSAVVARAGGLMSIAVDSSGPDSYGFYSRNSSTNQPVLLITYR